MGGQGADGSKLGICVVYVADSDFAWMIDLHLRAIERFTRDTEFVVYAGLANVTDDVRHMLAARSFVRIVDTEPTDKTKAAEHAHHMEQLVEAAIADGCAHIATFDCDSFPVHPQWYPRLAAMLSPDCPLVAVSRTELGDVGLPHPCGMLFLSSFRESLNPRFLPPKSRAELRYRRRRRLRRDTGIGFGVTLDQAGLAWHALEMTARPAGNIVCAAVYGDLIFHFGGGVQVHVGLQGHEHLIHYLYRRLPWFPPLSRRFHGYLARVREKVAQERALMAEQLRADPEAFLSNLVGRPVGLDG